MLILSGIYKPFSEGVAEKLGNNIFFATFLYSEIWGRMVVTSSEYGSNQVNLCAKDFLVFLIVFSSLGAFSLHFRRKCPKARRTMGSPLST